MLIRIVVLEIYKGDYLIVQELDLFVLCTCRLRVVDKELCQHVLCALITTPR